MTLVRDLEQVLELGGDLVISRYGNYTTKCRGCLAPLDKDIPKHNVVNCLSSIKKDVDRLDETVCLLLALHERTIDKLSDRVRTLERETKRVQQFPPEENY